MRSVASALLPALCLSFFFTVSAHAEWISLGGDQGAGVALLESSPSRVALEVTVDGFERTDVEIGGEIYSQIRLPGDPIYLEAGFPELPKVATSVIIPDDRRMELHVVSADYVDFPGMAPTPSKGDLPRTVNPDDVPYVFGPFYETDGWFPEEAAGASDPYILRDFRGMTVGANPFSYQPSTHTLRVYTRIEIELVDAGPGTINVLEREAPLSSVTEAFEEIYSNHFLNYGQEAEAYTLVPEVGSMLVIAYDSFADAVQPFVDWKNQMGLPTTLVLKSAVGTTSTQFQTYIQNAYDASSEPKLAFVLLVGDGPQIPSPSSDGGSADPLYSLVAGTDNYPDIFIGRFSAENISQVQTQVGRTIDYELSPLLAGDAWYPKGTGIASNQGPGDDGEYDYQHMNVIRDLLLSYGYTQVDQIYDPTATASMITNALNEGRGIVNYCGHGSMTSWGTTGYNNNSVNGLQNDHMLPFIFSVACQNGRFASGTCFAEAWLRATNGGNPTGAVGFYGASIDQSWNPPMCAQDESDHLLCTDAARCYGSLCYNGSCEMMDEYGSGGASMFRTWHVFGDPSLCVRTKVPTALSVEHDPSIEPDAATYPVSVPGVEGALCALSYQGAFIGSAFTNGAGDAVIDVQGTLPEGETVQLTVTGYNHIPYLASVQVEYLAIPTLVCDPPAFDVQLPPDSQMDTVLHLTNMGEPESILNFSSTFVPGSLPPWVTFTPRQGSIPYGETVDVAVHFSSVGRSIDVYTGSLKISYNPDQTTAVPVTMTVGDATGVDDLSQVPARVFLAPPQPNPFAGSTSLSYGLPADGPIRLAVYDARGREVRVLAEGTAPAGAHQVLWNGTDAAGRPLATGVYFARLWGGGEVLTERMLRVR